MSNPTRLLLVLLVAIAARTELAAQDTASVKTLLWEISGNGLEKPSYLFGTMHRHDKRVFHFGDSVLIALARCRTFASELHIDSVIHRFLDQYLLRSDLYERMARISREHRKTSVDSEPGAEPADSAATATPRSRPFPDPKELLRDADSTGAVVSRDAVSAYDSTQAFDFSAIPVDSLAGERRVSGDTTVRLPRNTTDGSLEAASSDTSEAADAVVMADTMALRGADEGREADSTAVAVPEGDRTYATSTEDEDDEFSAHRRAELTIREKRSRLAERRKQLMSDGNQLIGGSEWVHSGDRPAVIDAYLFGVAKKLGMRLLGLEQLEEQLAISDDFGRMDFFDSPRHRLPRGVNGRRLRNPLTAEDEMVRMYADGDVEALHDVIRAMASNSSYLHTIVERNANMAERAEPLMREAPTFIAVGAGHLGGPQGLIARFRKRGFKVRPMGRSFRVPLDSIGFPPPQDEWATLTSAEGAFAVDMPSDPVLLSRENEGLGVDNDGASYVWPDVAAGIVYYAGYRDYDDAGIELDSAGIVREITDLALHEADNDEDEELPGVKRTRRTISVHGLPAVERESVDNDDKVTRRRVVVRGMRSYTLEAVALKPQAHGVDVERFFGSFRTLPSLVPAWTPYASSAGAYRVDLPGTPAESIDSSGRGTVPQEWQVEAKDAGSGQRFRVTCCRFVSYMQAADTARLLGFVADVEMGIDTTGAVRRAVTLSDGSPAVDLDMGDSAARYRRLVRMIVRGDRVYVLETVAGGDTLTQSGSRRFFDSFTFTSDSVSGDLFADKSDLLFAMIAHGPQVDRDRAITVMRRLDQSPEHLRRIYELLAQSYPDDDFGGGYRSTRGALLGVLADAHDSSTVAFLGRLYPEISWYDNLRSRLLTTLMTIGTDEAYTLLGRLVEREAAVGEQVSSLLQQSHSARELRVLGPTLVHLLAYPASRMDAADVLADAIDSGVVDRSALLPYRTMLVGELRTAVAAYRASLKNRHRSDDEDNDSFNDAPRPEARLYALLRIVGYLGNEEMDAVPLVKQAVAAAKEDEWLRLIGLVTLAQLGQPLPARDVRTLASDLNYRADLYRKLALIGRQTDIPRDFRSQQAIAEALLAEWLRDEADDETPDDVMLLGERTTTLEGREGRIFIFAFRNGTRKWNVGISGLQPIDRERVDPEAVAVISDFDDRDDMSIDEHYNKLVKQLADQ